jgi:pyocin large subunit-like protein
MPALQDHFDRHGADFAAKSPDDYAAKAWLFREQAVARKLPMKQDGDTVRIMDLHSLAFAAFNGDGTTKTYFRPRDASYWERQPGRLINTPPWAQK